MDQQVIRDLAQVTVLAMRTNIAGFQGAPAQVFWNVEKK